MTARDAFDPQETEISLSEERLSTSRETVETGRVRARKRSETQTVEQRVPRGVEHAEVERGGTALEGDSGLVETLEDGSLSIPVFEEQIVVEKRLVVRERIIVRKHTVYEEHVVSADLRREELDIEVDGDVAVTGDQRV
jgi:uncharacterized protein (TIGR02271 family)